MGLIGDLFEQFINSNVPRETTIQSNDTTNTDENTPTSEEELKLQITELQKKITELEGNKNNEIVEMQTKLLESQKLNLQYAMQQNVGGDKPQSFSEILREQPYHPSYNEKGGKK